MVNLQLWCRNALVIKGEKADFFGFESVKNPKKSEEIRKSEKIFFGFEICKISNPLFPPWGFVDFLRNLKKVSRIATNSKPF
jgi:hypothetical protein